MFTDVRDVMFGRNDRYRATVLSVFDTASKCEEGLNVCIIFVSTVVRPAGFRGDPGVDPAAAVNGCVACFRCQTGKSELTVNCLI